MKDIRIAKVETFVTQPSSVPLVVVRVRTSQDGLYGLGCATFTWRYAAVKAALDSHLGPLALGRSVHDVEDFWQTAMVNAYWRHGPVLNNALGGIDMALWDIKGKLAGMPCYQLWGGACRKACALYVHCDGKTPAELVQAVRTRLAEGFMHVRCQLGGYNGLSADTQQPPGGPFGGVYIDPHARLRTIPALFETLRAELGDGVELLHDVHERLVPADAVALAKALEPYRLFFLEDLLAPEDSEWFANVRSICATPLAMGELFTNPREIVPLVERRLIDFIRVHPSMIGGITPALKLARLCEAMGVRTAWHGPPDLTPIGMAANLHLDMACPNFGIQEWTSPKPADLEVFPGAVQASGGHATAPDRPGLGVDFDERAAARFPPKLEVTTWTQTRAPDGGSIRP